ncbi:MAG: MogA/MoaB family molybdenum cofactor biosynthesis protein [Phormidesmis sp. RL_2_1]|nr:MogA/MoaB family molybdenum cofactor biosynthesis protein [Phormidesmis sp. RL_2_1]
MTVQPHADSATPITVTCAVLTVSDSRTPTTDKSGQVMHSQLAAAGHQIGHYHILKDEPEQIAQHVQSLASRDDIQVILLNGGTGIAPRDTTYDAIAALLHKQLPGFGEIFRQLSYAEIGSRAIASRAVAGIHISPQKSTLIFSVPGSSNAVRLAMTALIIPELSHLSALLRADL